MAQQYCEHNRIGLLMYSLYGRFRVYTCALNKRHGRDWMAGWVEPCIAACANRYRKPGGERCFSFPYKRISFSDIPMSDEALEQEKKDKAERKAKAQELRNQACDLIAQASKLEEK